MSRVESKIQALLEPAESLQARTDWANVTGQRVVPAPVYYRNKETGAEYSHIAGGIGWPEADKPGYGFIIGVERETSSTPAFFILGEIEANHPLQVLEGCGELRERWGFHDHSKLLRSFSGDASRFASFVREYNDRGIKKHGDGYGRLSVVLPPGFNNISFFEGAVRQIQTLLMPNRDGRKRLYIGPCEKIRNAIQNMNPGGMSKAAAGSPPVMALGCVVHTLLTLTPWLCGTGAVNLPDENYGGGWTGGGQGFNL